MNLYRVRTEEWTFYVAASNMEGVVELLLGLELIDEFEPRHIEELRPNGQYYYVECTKREQGPHIEFQSGFRAKPVSFAEGLADLTGPELIAIGPIDCRIGLEQ